MLFLLLSKIFSLAKTNFLTLSINQNLECYPDFSIAFHIHKWLHSCFMHCSFVNRCKMFSPHYRLPISMANAKKKRKKNYNKTICCWLNSFCCILFLIAAYVAHISKAFLTCNSDEAGVISLYFFTRFFFSHFYAAPKLTVNFLLAAPHSPKIQFSMRESHSLFRPKWLSLTRWQHQLHANFVIIRIAFALCNWNATFGRLYAVGK